MVGNIINSILQIKKLRHGRIHVVHDHKASERQSQDLNAGSQAPESVPLGAHSASSYLVGFTVQTMTSFKEWEEKKTLR